MESRFTHVGKLQVAFWPLKRGPPTISDTWTTKLIDYAKTGGQGSLNTENISTEKHKQWLVTKQRDYAHEEFQRTISRETKHTLYCFKNCGLLHLSTQTFPKNIIVNHLINGEKRRKSKRLPAQRWKNQSTICNDVIGQNWSRGPCPTPPGL